MISITPEVRLMFVINAASGNNSINYDEELTTCCKSRGLNNYTFIHLRKDADFATLKERLLAAKPDRVIAVGGDGTIRLLAEILKGTPIALGIIPGGSANGMAKELGIPLKVHDALEKAVSTEPRKIHLVIVNNKLCIHLSDIGFNAYVVKTFDKKGQRGMLGYLKAAWKVLWRHSRMKVVFSMNGRTVQRSAVMVVLANATRYGTGVRINPEGKLDDQLFEVVIVRKISLTELFKMSFTQMKLNPEKTEVFQTNELLIKSRKRVHFQVDGEYEGKVNEITATLMPDALNVIY
jgi:diacylglycerol kinase (ATP)